MKTLRWYQKECFDAIIRAFRKKRGLRRALAVMATGLGKMVVAAFIAEWYYRTGGKGRILFIMDQTDPLGQARDEFDEARHHHAQVRTGMWTGNDREDVDADVLFTTFQSMEMLRHELPADEFDLIIVDEAHHAMAETYLKVITDFTPRYLLGMTATPNRMDNKDIRTVFGEEVYSLPLARAIALRLVPKIIYRVLSDNIDRAALRALVERLGGGDRKISRKDIDRTIFLRERLERAVAIIDEVAGDDQTIIFCTSKTHARQVNLRMPTGVQYHTGLKSDTLQRRLDEFRESTITRLIAIDKLNEAVDVPGVSVIVFLRSTESQTIWQQQLGRALRGGPDKTVIVLDFVANIDRMLEIKEFVESVERELPDDEDPRELRDRKTPISIEGMSVEFMEELRDLLPVLGRLQSNGDFYSYEKAQKRVREMGIGNYSAYHARYKEDVRLPSSPDLTYKESWSSWPAFFGRAKRSGFYTYVDARARVRAMNIHGVHEYKRRYKEDSRLMSNPHTHYRGKGWVSWYDFFGKSFYPYLEARSRVQELGIRTYEEYTVGKRYKEDRRLCSNPQKQYAGKGWISWGEFLGTA